MGRNRWKSQIVSDATVEPQGLRGDKLRVIVALPDKRFIQSTVIVPDSVTEEAVDELNAATKLRIMERIKEREENS